MNAPPAPIRWAHKKDIPYLKRLMKEIFGDQDYYINLFFHYKFEENVLVYEVDSQIISTVYLLPAKIYLKEKFHPITYLYACATKPLFRGKGVMGKLLNESFNIACQNENIGVFLLPASESLYTFYEKNLFAPFFYKKKSLYQRQQFMDTTSTIDKFEIINAKSYFLLRQQFLKNEATIHWDENHFILIEKTIYKKESYFFRITKNDTISVGFLSILDNQLTLRELIGNNNDKESIIAYLFQRFQVRTILLEDIGTEEKSGMIRINPSYSHLFEANSGYFAFGLD